MSHGLLLHPGSPFPWTEWRLCNSRAPSWKLKNVPRRARRAVPLDSQPGQRHVEVKLDYLVGGGKGSYIESCPERQPRHSREHNRGLCVRDLARWQMFQGSTALSCRKEPGWGRAAACPPGPESKGWGDECPACPPAPLPPLIFLFHWRCSLLPSLSLACLFPCTRKGVHFGRAHLHGALDDCVHDEPALFCLAYALVSLKTQKLGEFIEQIEKVVWMQSIRHKNTFVVKQLPPSVSRSFCFLYLPPPSNSFKIARPLRRNLLHFLI